VVDEIEAKSASVGVLIIRRGTDGRAKMNFCSSDPNTTKT
jgi:hypothetical protein